MTSTSSRTPMSVLAVRPKTKSPPRILIPEPDTPPSIPARAILPASREQPNRPLPPRRPVSSTSSSTSFVRQTEEGLLLPYIPDHYEITSNNKVRVVVPTVSESSLPDVVPTTRPKSPPKANLQSQLNGLRPSYTSLPATRPGSYPATLTGETPPINKGVSIPVPVLDLFKSSEGTIAYTRPVDITSYALSQDETPLPLEISEQPVILSATNVQSLPPPPSIPYRLEDLLSSNPAAPSLRYDPLILPSRIQRPLSPRYPIIARPPVVSNTR